MEARANHAIMVVNCPDRQGISARIANFIYQNKGNIIDIDQHVDKESLRYFMRVKWDLTGFSIPTKEIEKRFQREVADKFKMDWKVYLPYKKPRMAIFVSKYFHCLYDILTNSMERSWNVEIPLVISNHTDLVSVKKSFDVDFVHLPIDKTTKTSVEQSQLKILKDYKIDFIVLARYMQILSPHFVQHFTNRIINIHHSFLPAFPGAKPYHSAHKRGVKIIGATAHYVTSTLDDGPIISQDVVRVSHTDSVEDLIRKGKSLEKVVLAEAVWKHINRKIMVYKNRTVVFN